MCVRLSIRIGWCEYDFQTTDIEYLIKQRKESKGDYFESDKCQNIHTYTYEYVIYVHVPYVSGGYILVMRIHY